MPRAPTLSENSFSDGTMCGSELLVSAILSISKNTDLGICFSINSCSGLRRRVGRYHDPSTTRILTASILFLSQLAVTSGGITWVEVEMAFLRESPFVLIGNPNADLQC